MIKIYLIYKLNRFNTNASIGCNNDIFLNVLDIFSFPPSFNIQAIIMHIRYHVNIRRTDPMKSIFIN